MSVWGLGVLDVTCDTPTGLVVVQVNVTSHALAPDAMVHDGEAGERVPEICGALTAVTVIAASFEAAPLEPFLTATRYRPLCHPRVAKLIVVAVRESS